eukprot:TRINITY_DN8251_c0_g1_i1.p1 TRINITY_DN8251_c0_g1~~TRINITY_DN8251_c0_g1_i1.p1  ORF type:complete len:161 (-),score=7.11 TRINITY_DN8251_c0_g1_i1:394-876(-)
MSAYQAKSVTSIVDAANCKTACCCVMCSCCFCDFPDCFGCQQICACGPCDCRCLCSSYEQSCANTCCKTCTCCKVVTSYCCLVGACALPTDEEIPCMIGLLGCMCKDAPVRGGPTNHNLATTHNQQTVVNTTVVAMAAPGQHPSRVQSAQSFVVVHAMGN